MAMSPQERSKPLHNFSFPCLNWGSQKRLRCVKVTDEDDHHRTQNQNNRSSPSIPNGFQSNPTNKSNPLHHNHTSFDQRLNGLSKRFKLSPLQEEQRGGAGAGAGAGDDPVRPWNLRTRRAACKAPSKIEEKRNNNNNNNMNGNFYNIDSPTRRNNNLEIDSPRRNESLLVKNKQSVEIIKEKAVKFCVPLAKEEIEEDFLEMLRIRPPRRPKKRPRIVQKYLDTIFPGLWLSEVTPDAYKVAEIPES